MSLGLDLENILKISKIENYFEDNFFLESRKISPGILVERAVIKTIDDSGYFKQNFSVPSFFKKSSTGGYEFKLNNKSIFEIDDYKQVGNIPIYIEIKSGEIPNRYLDKNYKSKKDKFGTNVDIKKIFSISDKFNLNPNLVILYNRELMRNSRLLKRIQNQYNGRIQRVGFNFDFKYACDVVKEHNKIATKYQRGKKINLDGLY